MAGLRQPRRSQEVTFKKLRGLRAALRALRVEKRRDRLSTRRKRSTAANLPRQTPPKPLPLPLPTERGVTQERTEVARRCTEFFGGDSCDRAPLVRPRVLPGWLGKVRGWPAALKQEPEKALQKLGDRIGEDVEAGDAAIAGREEAAQARALQRVKQIITFIEDVNGARRSLYGTLVVRAQDRKLDDEWASQFFRRSARAPRVKKPEAPADKPV